MSPSPPNYAVVVLGLNRLFGLVKDSTVFGAGFADDPSLYGSR
jgi:hypothetical protein